MHDDAVTGPDGVAWFDVVVLRLGIPGPYAIVAHVVRRFFLPHIWDLSPVAFMSTAHHLDVSSPVVAVTVIESAVEYDAPDAVTTMSREPTFNRVISISATVEIVARVKFAVAEPEEPYDRPLGVNSSPMWRSREHRLARIAMAATTPKVVAHQPPRRPHPPFHSRRPSSTGRFARQATRWMSSPD